MLTLRGRLASNVILFLNKKKFVVGCGSPWVGHVVDFHHVVNSTHDEYRTFCEGGPT